MVGSIIVPLTAYDTIHNNSGITVAYVVQSVNVSSLRNAALRVVDKWRLMAGHIERSKDLSSWCIRVPMQGDIHHRLGFTASKVGKHLDPCYFVDTADGTTRVFSHPPSEYFRHPSVPNTLEGYLSSDAPILSIHVTELENCACIGIAFTHCVLDAFGMGQFIHALDKELHGKHWDVPPFSETSVLQGVLDDLDAAAPRKDEGIDDTASSGILGRVFAPSDSMKRLIIEIQLAYENRYRNFKTKLVYIPGETLEKLVRITKDEVARLTSGLGFVSTSDIISAWVLKATYSGETDNNDLHLNLIVSARKVLSDRYPALVDYPLNAIGPVPLPKITKQKLLAKSLPEVALWHRQGVQPFLVDSSWIQVTDTYFKSNPSPVSNGIRPRQWGEEPLYFTNQILAHLEDIDFGSKMHLMWLYYTPTDAFHSITINKFKSGYLVQGSLRPKRWDAVDEAVEKLNMRPSS
ncbi:hypothetical protein DXG01_000496 [Tephrocybe rancida]|nr:hypothetical protein DXG01_000496 [Tephrocybe rancida]